MKLIDVENKKPVIDPVALTIKEFKVLWERDKSKDKRMALEELAFVYFSANFTSPYKRYVGEERTLKIKEAVISVDTWEPDQAVEDAIERYRQLQTTPSLGLLEDAETAVHKLREYFRETDIRRSREGAAAKNLLYNLKQLGDVVKSLQALKKLVEEEQYTATSIRGQGQLGKREKPRNRRK